MIIVLLILIILIYIIYNIKKNKIDFFNILEEHECSLLVQIFYNQEEEKEITDFTMYKNHGIVGLQIYELGPPDPSLEDNLIFFPKAKVSYIKPRGFPDSEAVWIWEPIEE